MFEAFLSNTSTQGLSPLGTAPQRSFELISGTVRDRLGDRHAAVFAEPVATQYGDRFDWYAAVAGKPHALGTLDPEDQKAVQDELDGLLGDIVEIGQELLDNKDPDQQRLGEALLNAARYPGEDSVYVLVDGDDKQPVLLNWAWVSDTQATVVGDLSGEGGLSKAAKVAATQRAAAAAPIASSGPVTAPPPRGARGPLNLWWLMWFGWLLLMLMIGAILYLMVEACAIRIPGVPNYCPPPGPTASEEARTTQWLRDQIASTERQIGIADRACQPEQQASIVPDANSNRLVERGAQEGELTISLLWDSIADLHLDVKCPSNQTINFDNKSACGGQLDVGGNHNRATAKTNAIESMYFNAPAAGSYSVAVSLYDPHGQSATQPFRLRIKDGETVKIFEGQVTARQLAWTTVYNLGKGN